MFLIRVFQNERFNRFLRFFASLIDIDGSSEHGLMAVVTNQTAGKTMGIVLEGHVSH